MLSELREGLNSGVLANDRIGSRNLIWTLVMFVWLKEEIGAVRTPKMFLFEQTAQTKKIQEVEEKYGKLPEDYIYFVATFGHAAMLRDRYVDIHLLGVFSCPLLKERLIPEKLLQFGFCEEAAAFFLPERQTRTICPGVFSLRVSASKPHLVGDTFEEWLKASFYKLKKRYGKRGWQEIQKGPAPFNLREMEIVNAIGLYAWRRIGVTDDGRIKIEVHNGSQTKLPYLSVGVLVPNKLKGGVRLPVSDLEPGHTKVVEVDCYRKQASPEEVQLFAKEPPGPEDREYRWEFKPLSDAGG